MRTNFFLILLLIFIVTPGISQQIRTPGNCEGYSVKGNTVTFHCEESAKVRLKLCSNSVVKVWFAPDGTFKRSNDSFAVVNENIEDPGTLKVNESASAYEIFTGPLRIRVNRKPFQLQIFNKWQKLLFGGYENKGFQYEGTEIRAINTLRADEHFFGLGEKTGNLDRRGKTFTMWNSDKPCYSDEEDPLYKSIPFFMSNYNYGIFFDNTYKTAFDFGKDSKDYFSFSSPDGPFVYYFIHGKDYKEIIGNYTQLTGNPIMPPKWALGWSQSRGMLTNEVLTREIAEEYRKRNIPCDIIYQDIGWVDGLQNFEWRKDRYEAPARMLSDLEKDGFKVIVSQDPVVSRSTKKQWEEADSLGYFTTDERTGKTYDMPWPWGGNCGVVDFSDPEVADWWGELQQKPLDDGVKGFWTDMGEPAWSNEESTERLYMKHHLGMHDEMHNVYGLLWDKVVTEQFEKRNPGQRVFQMTRAAYAGMQRYTFGWSGDSGNGSDVTDGWDNLANQIPMGLSAGMGLIPFWTTDISGYCGDITDYDAFSELYIRWLQFGIFNPLSRAHHEGNNAVEPWLFGEKAEKIARAAIALKYSLHPYMYTYAREAYDTGMPIMRALVLEYPRDENTYTIDEQFMFGREILVAPVVKEGAITKKVYLPKGKWVDYHSPRKIFEGGQYIDYPAPLDKIPMFIRSGAIIPEMPVMPYIGAMKNAPVILDIYPGAAKTSSFVLYEDDGTSNDYKQDIHAKTKIECTDNKDAIFTIVHESESSGGFETEIRNYWIKIHLAEKPGRVDLNDKKLKKSAFPKLKKDWNTDFELSGYSWDKEKKLLYIRFPDAKKEQTVNIEK